MQPLSDDVFDLPDMTVARDDGGWPRTAVGWYALRSGVEYAQLVGYVSPLIAKNPVFRASLERYGRMKLGEG